MKNFTKLLLLICVVFLASQMSKAQSIVASYNCTGLGSATLSVSPTTGITAYSWKSTTGTFTASTATITQASGSYSVVITKATGTQAISAVTIATGIVPTPPSVTPPSVPSAICGSTTQTLTSGAAANYTWLKDGVAISGATASTYSVSGNSVAAPTTNNYAVSVLNPTTACSAISNQVSITLSPKPATPSISPVSPNLLCGANTTTLTATGGGTTYTWKRGATVLGSTINTYIATGTEAPAGNYSYTVSYVNSAGCPSDDSAPVALVLSPKPATPVISPPSLTTPICGVATQALTVASGATNYSWKRDGAGITGSTNSITVTGTDVATGGTYAYSVSSQNAVGCTSDESAVVSLKVSPKPVTPIIMPASFTPNIICGTDTKTLTATSGGAKYNWLRNGTLVTSSTTSNALTVAGTDVTTGGTYSYTVSLENLVGCVSDVSTSAVVLQLFPTVPTKPTVANSGGLTFCEGGSVTLTSSYTGNTNIWSRTVGADTTTSTTAGIIVRTTNTLTVKAKDVNGCASLPSLPIVVTVNLKPLPPVIDLSGARGICESDSITLTSDNKGSGIYQWKKDNVDLTRNTSITAKTAGNYTVIYTDTQTPACTSLPSVATVLTINPLPVRPTIANLSSTEFCYRQFTTLRASSTTTGATFEWDYQNKTGSQIDVAGSAKLTTVEIIKITAKSVSVFANNPKACKSRETSDVVTITVNPLPTTPNIAASGPLTFCPDSTVSLTSTDSPNGVYKWINAKDNSEFSANKTVLIDTTSKFFNTALIEKVGKFYVRTISNKSCVSDTSRNITITVRNAPQPASITADPRSATVCLGGKVTMKALVANGNIAKYSWRDESTLQEVSTEPEVSVITSGSFSVKVRDIYGCFAAFSKPLKVSINSLPNKPTLTLIKPKVFCDEDSVVVQASEASTTPKGKKTSYRWIVDGLTVTESFESVFSWKRVGVISVALTDSNGCKAATVSDTIRTTVNPLPSSPTITVRGANPFCADKNVALNAVGANGVTYKWSTGATTQTITTNTAGNITVQAINGFGCLSKPSQPVLIRVNPLPAAPKLTANGDVTFCEGSRVRIVSSSAFKAYWFRSTTDSIGLGDDNTSIFASKSGSYFAKVQDDNGCISLASAPIAVDSRPNPTPTVIKKVGSFTLDAQGIGDENGYLWRYNGDLQRDLTTRLIKAKKDGDYQVQASITYTGVNIAGGKLVCYSKVSDAIKYEQDISFEGVSIFPNPSADGVIYIEAIEDLIDTKIMIYDLYGRIMADYTIDKFNTLKRFELPNLHGTTYIVKISSGGLEKTRKVLIF
jgi:hypothetical protein